VPNLASASPLNPVVFATSAILSSNFTASLPAKTSGAMIAAPATAAFFDIANADSDIARYFRVLRAIASSDRLANVTTELVIALTGADNLSIAVKIVGITAALVAIFIFYKKTPIF
jgi:hypothetical protein